MNTLSRRELLKTLLAAALRGGRDENDARRPVIRGFLNPESGVLSGRLLNANSTRLPVAIFLSTDASSWRVVRSDADGAFSLKLDGQPWPQRILALEPRSSAGGVIAPLPPMFRGRSGVSIDILGFGDGVGNNYSAAAFDRVLTSPSAEMLVSMGFDHVRLACDPSPGLAAENSNEEAAAIDVALHAVQTLLSTGLNVIVDLHVGGGAGEKQWTAEKIQRDYPDQPRWLRYLAYVARVTSALAVFPPERVAIEQWNETTLSVSDDWPAMAHSVWTAIRTANPNITILVSGAEYASVKGLQQLRAKDFDARTGFVVHTYEPMVFTHQGIASGPTPKVSRMSYPAARSQWESVTQGQTSKVRAYLSNYFDAGRFGYDGLVLDDRVWSKADKWLMANGVPPSSLFATEMGCHGDALNTAEDMPGASIAARAKWFQDNSSICAARGISRTYWSYGADNNVWNFCTDGTPDPAILAAFGNHCPLSLFEPESRLLIGRMLRPPSAARQTHLNAVVRLLKQSDLWARLDAFYLFGHYNAARNYPEQDAVLNFIGPRFDCRQVGGGEWSDGIGFASDGRSGFLDTNLAPGLSRNSSAEQNSVCMALRRSGPWRNTGAPAALASEGLRLALQQHTLSARCFDLDGPAPLSLSTFSMTDVTFAASRSRSEGWVAYLRGSRAFLGDEPCPDILRASGPPDEVSVKVGRADLSTSSAPDQFHRCVAIGAGLTEEQMRALTTVMDFAVDGLALMA